MHQNADASIYVTIICVIEAFNSDNEEMCRP